MRLLLLGPPGSGKGTQGQRLAQTLNVPHIATGDIIRDHIARGTEFGHKVEAAIAQGNFAPDEDIIYWVSRRLEEADARRGYILDGFPRDLAQAQEFDAKAPEGRAFDAVLELTIDEAALTERLSGRLVCPVCHRVYHTVHCPPRVAGRCDFEGAKLERRPDDAPDAVRHRFQVYDEVTLPLRQYYTMQGTLRSVDGGGDPDEVQQRLVKSLSKLGSERKIASSGV